MKKTDYIQFNKDILLQIIREISGPDILSDKDVMRIISKNPSKDSKTFSKSQIIEAYKFLKIEAKLSPAEEKKFLDLIKMKRVRTMSGVTPVAVLTKPFPCPGNCIYCPNDPEMPKSYLSSEPGAQRAFSNDFDPYLQVYNRLVAYKNIGHPTDKVELIVLGGTWSFYPENYQIWFIERCFEAMNDFDPLREVSYLKKGENSFNEFGVEEKAGWDELFLSQKINETAKSRCVGLVLETRPDYISKDEVVRMRKLGATKIQIGVQSLNDAVLKLNKRGHDVKSTEKAFRILRSAGFKIQAHWMPNLAGSDPEKDVRDFDKLFSNENFRPDELKIYPCSLIEGTELFDFYEKGKWKPYTEDELLYVLENCLFKTPRYCRITRVVRDISSEDIVVGNKKSNFRQIVEKSLKNKDVKIEEIRFREIRNEKVDIQDLELKIFEYDARGSKEYFLEYVTKEDRITGFLRLSIPKGKPFIKELENSAVIREVHVYGGVVGIGKEEKGRFQHMGLGSKLIIEAEKISKDIGFNRISVISSVGTREYYTKRGYILDSLYQTKNL